MNRSEFDRRFRELKAAEGGSNDNPGSLACERCEGCIECQFCRDSEGLVRCRYCVASTHSTDCSHSENIRNCHGSTHCKDCEHCIKGAYLEQCIDCRNCSYCFGCVGLTNRDFHILNEPYDRKTYFATLEALGVKK